MKKALDFMQAGDFDTLLVAGRYTLLEQDALDELLPLCERKLLLIGLSTRVAMVCLKN